jgi:hypothetical protein
MDQRLLGSPPSYSLGGAYVNFMMKEGIDRIKATYRDNYNRLVESKRKYDPENFFRISVCLVVSRLVSLAALGPHCSLPDALPES